MFFKLKEDAEDLGFKVWDTGTRCVHKMCNQPTDNYPLNKIVDDNFYLKIENYNNLQ